MLRINTKEQLAHRLGIPLHVLEGVRSQKNDHYKPFKIASKSGRKSREAFRIAPNAMHILDKINRLLMDELHHPSYFHGGMKGKTIRSNASAHAAKSCIIKLDIKNFYPSVTRAMVISALQQHAGMSADAAGLVGDLATYDGRLMTGSPCSTILSSLVIRRATERINGLVTQRGGQLSVYVDDVTISGGAHLKAIEGSCVRFIEEAGVTVHPKKRIRTSGTGFAKIVTGVDVSGGIDATPAYKAEVKEILAELEQKFVLDGSITEQEHQRAVGKVQHLSTLNKGMAQRLKTRHKNIL